jgi:hypothetical protein
MTTLRRIATLTVTLIGGPGIVVGTAGRAAAVTGAYQRTTGYRRPA